MASDDLDRDAVLRAKLIQRVSASSALPRSTHRDRPSRSFATIVTAVVLIVVVAASITALRLAHGGAAPAVGGSPSIAMSNAASGEAPAPAETLPPGKLLARFTSKDGPNQDHTVHVGGYAIATQFICTGDGNYAVFTANGTGESGDGGCSGGGVGAGGVNVKGSTKVRIRTDPDMTWTYTLVGITPPKRVQLKSIPNPTDSTGVTVPYCTSDDLTVRFLSGIKFDTIDDPFAGELVFTNQTSTTCALAGYPEVRFLSDGKPLGHNTMNQIDPKRTTDLGLKAVVVAPNASAYSQIHWYEAGSNDEFEGPCVKRAVNSVQVNLSYDFTDPRQTGTFAVPIGNTTACLNGQHGALGKYGQISSTVFLDYSTKTTE